VVVPNNNLIANDLINWTLSDSIKRIEILIGTTYGSDPNQILKILTDEVAKNQDALNKKRNQFLKEAVLPPNGITASENIYNELIKELG